MKIKQLFAAFAVLCLGACASMTAKQQAENADTTALSTYATIGKLIDAYETPRCGLRYCDAMAEGLRTKAWALLQQEHTAYLAGETAAALNAVQALQDIVIAVKGLGA